MKHKYLMLFKYHVQDDKNNNINIYLNSLVKNLQILIINYVNI